MGKVQRENADDEGALQLRDRLQEVHPAMPRRVCRRQHPVRRDQAKFHAVQPGVEGRRVQPDRQHRHHGSHHYRIRGFPEGPQAAGFEGTESHLLHAALVQRKASRRRPDAMLPVQEGQEVFRVHCR